MLPTSLEPSQNKCSHGGSTASCTAYWRQGEHALPAAKLADRKPTLGAHSIGHLLSPIRQSDSSFPVGRGWQEGWKFPYFPVFQKDRCFYFVDLVRMPGKEENYPPCTVLHILSDFTFWYLERKNSNFSCALGEGLGIFWASSFKSFFILSFSFLILSMCKRKVRVVLLKGTKGKRFGKPRP